MSSDDASAPVGDATADGQQQQQQQQQRPTRYWCHICSDEAHPPLPELKCDRCGGEFLEEMTDDGHFEDEPEDEEDEDAMEDEYGEEEDYVDEDEMSDEGNDNELGDGRRRRRQQQPPPPPMGGLQFVFGNVDDANNPFGHVLRALQGQVGGGRGGGRRMVLQGDDLLPLLQALLGGQPLGPRFGNLGDYVFSQRDFDNIISRTLEQATANAPPPASEESLQRLPRRSPTQVDIDNKRDCAVCKDDITLESGQLVELPCAHLYHEDCVIPWLREHGTCPVCRKRVDETPAPAPAELPPEPTTDLTDLD